jgi:hypothetical protein
MSLIINSITALDSNKNSNIPQSLGSREMSHTQLFHIALDQEKTFENK